MKYVLRVKVCFSIFALFAAFNAKITRQIYDFLQKLLRPTMVHSARSKWFFVKYADSHMENGQGRD